MAYTVKLYNKDSFIVPINNDRVLKLRDINGDIHIYIAIPDCTIIISNSDLLIKQQIESQVLRLRFGSNSEALIA